MQKILISSFAVSPKRGSEAGLGWNYCTRIGKYYDATVIYGSEKRTFQREFGVEEFLKENGEVPNVKFIWVEPSAFARKLLLWHDKTGFAFLYYWCYQLWQKKALKTASELHAKENFDLFHQFNMIGFRQPGYLWKLNKPFVWGPVGGTVNISLKFYKLLGFGGTMKSLLRNTANFLQLRFSKRVNGAGNKASMIIAASTSEKNNLLKPFKKKNIIVLNETGTNAASSSNKVINMDRPLTIVWSGNHIPGKALPFLLEALKPLNNKIDFNLIILGKGKETARWKKLAEKNGLNDKIKWLGHVDRSIALEIMSQTDITAFTSLKEGTPHVVLESLTLGIPVICFDICGMGDVITADCGIKVAAKNENQMIADFSAAIELINNDRKLLAHLSDGAMKRAQEYHWDKKTSDMAAVYAQALSN